jgi:hypothetical protein
VIDPWIGPAIIAAAVSGVVSVIGWFATFYMGLRRDRMLRDEKVHDFQVALRAEIASDLLTMVVADRAVFMSEAEDRYAAADGYSVVVPHMARNLVFESLLDELHLLPGEVIEPVIHYERMRETIERFVADLRDETFRRSPAERQLLMYSDYLKMLERLEQLARDAYDALNESINSPDVDLSTPGSASAVAVASASQRELP